MNHLEHLIYHKVKSISWLKYLIRNTYQSIFDLLPRKKEYFKSSYQYKENYFFGFHDVSPFSFDATKILSNRIHFDLRMPGKTDTLDVGYFDFDNGIIGDYHTIDTSYAWNYHKGCRLQWLSANEIIFNTIVNGKPLSKIINIITNKVDILDYFIDSVSKDSLFASSFSYQRLERCMPGYGYHVDDLGFNDDYNPSNTGLFLVNINDNSKKLLISIDELKNELNNNKYDKYWHFVTHSEFSCDNRYVSFLHRWINNDIKKHWSRLVIYDLKENKYFSLPTEEMVSHYVWNKKNQIIAYCTIDGISCHVLFDISNNTYKKIAYKELNSDGHQYFINDELFITDTYPDKNRMIRLFKVNINTEDVTCIAYIFSPKEFQTKDFYKHIACDLHPRVSCDRKYVCFDSARTGIRSMYIMSL